MKCVKKNEEIRRVSDAVADDLIAKGWAFCGKQEWKNKVRDIKAVKVEEPTPDPNDPEAVRAEKRPKGKKGKA